MTDDLADTVESERFREILSMKKQVLETKDEIDRARINRRVNQGAAIRLYQRKVRDYLMSVETVLNPEKGSQSRYWDDVLVGKFSLPDGQEKEVVGLREFLELPTSFEIEVETTRQRSYRHKNERVIETQIVRPPERLIEQAFRLTNRALDAAGFDLDEFSEKQKSGFRNIDDVEKATKVLDFLRALDDDGLKEVQSIIQRELLGDRGEMTNGHHE